MQAISREDKYIHITETQRKEQSRIAQRIKAVKRTIATEEEVASQFPITSYMLNRFSHSIDFHTSRLEKLRSETDHQIAEMTERFEKMKNKLLTESSRATVEITEKLERSREDYKKEEECLKTSKKTKVQIKAELELKELQEQYGNLFGKPEEPVALKPSTGFSSIAEEVSEMNRQQQATRDALKIPSYTPSSNPELTPEQKEELRLEKERKVQKAKAEREERERQLEEEIERERERQQEEETDFEEEEEEQEDEEQFQRDLLAAKNRQAAILKSEPLATAVSLRLTAEPQTTPTHPSNTVVQRILPKKPVKQAFCKRPEGDTLGVPNYRQQPFGGIPSIDTKQMHPPPPTKKPVKQAFCKRPEVKSLGPGIACYNPPKV